MNILIITYDFPYPTTSGGKSRIYNMMKFVKSNDIALHLIAFVRDEYKPEYNKELEKIGVDTIKVFKRKKTKNPGVILRTALGSSSIFKNLYTDRKAQSYIERIVLDKKIDSVLFESFYTAFYMNERIKKLGVKQIFGTENIEHILYFDFAKTKKFFLRKIYIPQIERVRKEEERAYNKADEILAVSLEEKKYISQKTKNKISIIPNGINTVEFSYKPKSKTGKNLLFVGNFSYFPNIDAMDFFYKNVFQNIPDAMLTIVGKSQNKLPFLVNDKRVKNIEYIEDIKSAYYDADIFIFPVRFGGGTNFKVLEAASCGIPILAIPDRVKGLGMVADKHFVSASTPTEFLAGVRRLTEEKNLVKNITKNARELMESEYDWRKIGEKLRKILIETNRN